jgi:general secretion pathway protein J
MKTNRGARKRELGFSLVETLVALALTGMLLTALAAVTGQWLPSWRHGFAGMQRLEALEVAIERLAADIAAAKPITANRTHAPPLFTGGPNAIVFVREAIGPNWGARLEWVRVAELENGLVRSRAPYAPVADDAAQPTFADPVELAPGSYRFHFSYSGPDRAWANDWVGRATLPSAVRIDVFAAGAEQSTPLSTTVALRVEAPAACAGQASIEDCVNRLLEAR